MIRSLKRNILLAISLAAISYLILSFYADYESVVNAFKKFNWFLFPLLLLLSYLNYTTRFIKWDFYLKLLKIKIKRIDSFQIFMSGLIMSVTPGKMGELLKSYLVKQTTNEPISKTAPIILVERVTDFLSLMIIAIIGAYVFDYGKLISVGVMLFFIVVVLVVLNRKLALKILELMKRIAFLEKISEKLRTAYESAYILLKPSPLFKMIGVSFISWFFECFGFFLILDNFQIDVSLLWSAFVYAFSTIVGAITMLPGGLGATEGSLTFMLNENAIPLDVAVASTFIIRVVTLWFAVLVGIISVLFYQRKFGSIQFENSDLKKD